MEKEAKRAIIKIIAVSSLIILFIVIIFLITLKSEFKNTDKKPIIEEQRKHLMQEDLQNKRDFIDMSELKEFTGEVYFDKEREKLSNQRVKVLMDNTIRELEKLDFTKAQNFVDETMVKYDASESKVYKENQDFFIDLVVMANYNDMFGHDEGSIIEQITQSKDERIILTSTLKLEPEEFIRVLKSPDSNMPIVFNEIIIGEIIEENRNENNRGVAECLRFKPSLERISSLEFTAEDGEFKAYFSHLENEVSLIYIEDINDTGEFMTINEWNEFINNASVKNLGNQLDVVDEEVSDNE